MTKVTSDAADSQFYPLNPVHRPSDLPVVNVLDLTDDEALWRERRSKSLTFFELHEANGRRLPRFLNALGEPAHSQPDGSDWSIAEWTNAICGEAGEAANVAKKMIRGDYGPKGSPGYRRAELALLKELADVTIYSSIAARRANGELGEAVRQKFNEVSNRAGCPDIKL